MATIKQFETDDSALNIDDDFDFNFGDYDSEYKEPKDDRTPISSGAKAAFKSFKSNIGNKQNIEKMFRTVLPRGYGEALDVYDASAMELGGLYDSAAEALQPAKNEIKNVVRKLTPKIDSVIPKKLADKLKGWSKDTSSNEWSSSSSDNGELERTIAEIFGAQNKQREADRALSVSDEQIKQGIEQVRHRDNVGYLRGIWESTDRLAQYQDNVLVNYQKKTLELQVRSYRVHVESFAEQKRINAVLAQNSANIVKNTGLPDFVKSKATEHFAEITRNKFLNDIRDSFFGTNKEYMQTFAKNIHKNVMATVGGIADGVGLGGSLASMALDDDEFGPKKSKSEQVGGYIGQGAGMAARHYAAKGLRKAAGKNRTVRKVGEKLSYSAENLGSIVDGKLSSSSDWGVFNFVKDFLQENKPSLTGTTAMQMDSLSTMHRHVPYSRQDSKSIREVIPGLLSAIHRELRVTRTGDESTGLMVYDYKTNKFSSQSAVGANLLKQMVGTKRKAIKDDLNSLLDKVDPSGSLTPEQRRKALETLVDTSINGKGSDISRLGLAGTWGEGPDARAISGAFNRHLKATEAGVLPNLEGSIKRQRVISRTLSDTGTRLGDPRAEIQALINAGQADTLRAAGIIDEKGSINRERFKEVILSSDEDGLGGEDTEQSKKTALTGETVFNAIKSKIDSLSGSARDVPQESTLVKRGKDFLSSAADKVSSYQTETLQEAKSVLSSFTRKGKARAKAVIAEYEARIKAATTPEAIDALADEMHSKLESLKEQAGEQFGAAKDAALGNGKVQEAFDKAKSLTESAKEQTNQTIDSLKEIVRDAIAQAATMGSSASAPALYSEEQTGTLSAAKARRVKGPEGKRAKPLSSGARVMRERLKGRATNINSRAEEGQESIGFSQLSEASSANTLEIITRLDKIIESLSANGGYLKVFTERMTDEEKDENGNIITSTLKKIEQGVRDSIGVQLLVHKKAVEEAQGEEGAQAKYADLWEHFKASSGAKYKEMKSAYGSFADKHRDKVKGALGSAKEKLMGAKLFGKNLFQKSSSKLLGKFGDIYVGSEKSPRMTKVRMAAGYYLDKATNTVISSLEGIKGEVVDRDGNVVLGIDDIGEAFVGGEVREKLTGVIGMGFERIKQLKDQLLDIIPGAKLLAQANFKRAFTAAKALLPPYDVYVKGEGTTPVLYAAKMRLGHYTSQKTGEVIKHPREIDGVVLEGKNIAISDEMIKKGLVDSDGISIVSGVARQILKAGAVVKRGFAFLKGAASSVIDFAGNMLGGIKDYFKDIFGGFGEVITNSHKSLKVLEAIHDLLNTRLPGGKKVLGDLSGDGVRDGSYQDILNKRKEKEKEDKEDKKKASGESKPGYLSALMGKLGALFSGKGKGGDEEDEDSGTDVSIDLGGGEDNGKKSDSEKRRDKAKKMRRSRSRGKLGSKALKGLKRLPGMGGTFGKVLGKGAGLLGRGATAAGSGVARALPFAGKVLGGAGRLAAATTYTGPLLRGLGAGAGLLGRGALGVGAGAVLAGSGLAAAAPVIGSVVGALLSWPATLAMGAAYVGWKVYKNSQATKLDKLSAVRVAQYGFASTQQAEVEKVLALEDYVTPHITLDDSGKISLDHKKIDTEEIMEMFAIKGKDSMQIFNKWYHKRFRPVLASWLLGLKKIAKDSGKEVKLSKVSSLKAEQKKELLKVVTSGMEQAYEHTGSPFGGSLVMSSERIAQAVELALTQMDKELKDSGAKTIAASAALTVAGAKSTPEDMVAKLQENRGLYSVVDKDGKTIEGDLGTQIERVKAGTASIVVSVSTPDDLVYTGGGRVDAMSAIRYKCYGLKDMDRSKVRTLWSLERLVGEYVELRGDEAVLKTKTAVVLAAAGSVFGVAELTGEKAQEWKSWFNSRFLPAFLSFANGVMSITKAKKLSVGIDSLAPADQLVVMTRLIALEAVGPDGARRSIWKITNTPWEGYELETNPDTTASNLEAIRLLAKKIILGEVSKDKPAVTPSGVTTAKAPKQEVLGKSAIISPDGKLNLTGNNTVEGSGMHASGDAMTDTGKALSAKGKTASITGGSGGKLSSMPNAGGGSGWGAVKDIIISAAKMVGVDAESLASIAAIESGFNPNAVAKGTNAAGLFQFLPSTWQYMIKKHGAKYGIDSSVSALDPRANAILGAQYLKDNLGVVRKNIGREVTAVDGYMAHFLGPTGASKFLRASSGSFGSEVSSAAAKANPNIFFKSPKSMSGPKTVGEIYADLTAKFEGKKKSFGVSASDFTGTSTTDQVSSSSPSASGSPSAPSTPGATPSSPGAPTMQGPVAASGSRLALYAPTPGSAAAPITSASAAPAAPGLSQPSGSEVSTPVNPGITASSAGGAMELVLQREESTDSGTYGTLRLPDGTTLHVLELPWIENKPRVSCIPAGQYKAKKRQTTSFGMAYEVMNVPSRSGILIHAGNYAGNAAKGMKANSQGCILLGMGRAKIGSQASITQSKAAIALFGEKTGGKPFTLTIRPAKGQAAQSAAIADAVSEVKAPNQNISVEKVGGSYVGSIKPPPTPAPGSSPVEATTPAPSAASTLRKASSQAVQATPTAAVVAPEANAPSTETKAPSFDRAFKPSAQDMRVQAQANVQTSQEAIGSIKDTLIKSLAAQTSGNEYLKGILEKVSKEPIKTQSQEAPQGPSEAPGESKSQSSTIRPSAPQKRTAETPKGSVDMGRLV